MYLSRSLDESWISEHDDAPELQEWIGEPRNDWPQMTSESAGESALSCKSAKVAYYFRLPMAFMEAGHEAEAGSLGSVLSDFARLIPSAGDEAQHPFHLGSRLDVSAKNVDRFCSFRSHQARRALEIAARYVRGNRGSPLGQKTRRRKTQAVQPPSALTLTGRLTGSSWYFNHTGPPGRVAKPALIAEQLGLLGSKKLSMIYPQCLGWLSWRLLSLQPSRVEGTGGSGSLGQVEVTHSSGCRKQHQATEPTNQPTNQHLSTPTPHQPSKQQKRSTEHEHPQLPKLQLNLHPCIRNTRYPLLWICEAAARLGQRELAEMLDSSRGRVGRRGVSGVAGE